MSCIIRKKQLKFHLSLNQEAFMHTRSWITLLRSILRIDTRKTKEEKFRNSRSRSQSPWRKTSSWREVMILFHGRHHMTMLLEEVEDYSQFKKD